MTIQKDLKGEDVEYFQERWEKFFKQIVKDVASEKEILSTPTDELDRAEDFIEKLASSKGKNDKTSLEDAQDEMIGWIAELPAARGEAKKGNRGLMTLVNSGVFDDILAKHLMRHEPEFRAKIKVPVAFKWQQKAMDLAKAKDIKLDHTNKALIYRYKSKWGIALQGAKGRMLTWKAFEKPK